MVREVAPPKISSPPGSSQSNNDNAPTTSSTLYGPRSPTASSFPASARRPLHERTKSQTNLSPSRLSPYTSPRLAAAEQHPPPFEYSLDKDHDAPPSEPHLISRPDNVYTRSPFPLKPAHILTPGRNDEAGPSSQRSSWQGALDVSDVSRSTTTAPSTRPKTPSNNNSLTQPSSRTRSQWTPTSPAATSSTETAALLPTSPSSSRLSAAPKRIRNVTVHADKTFSVLDVLKPTTKPANESSNDDRLKSQNRNLPSLRTSRSKDQLSLVASAVNRADSREAAARRSSVSPSPTPRFPDSRRSSMLPTLSPSASLALASPGMREGSNLSPEPAQPSPVASSSRLSETPSLVSVTSTAATEQTIPGYSHKYYPESTSSHSESTLVLVHTHDSDSDRTEDYLRTTPPAAQLNENYEVLGHTSSAEASPKSDNSVIGPGRHFPSQPPSSESEENRDSPIDSSERNFTVLGRSSPTTVRHFASESSFVSQLNSSPPEPLSPSGQNYEILGRTSPADPSSDEPNFEVLGRTSPAEPSSPSSPNYDILGRTSPAPEPSSEANYEILDRTSPTPVPSSPANSNYEVLGRTSPVQEPSSEANYEVLGRTSPVGESSSPNYEILGRTSPGGPSSSPNYQVLGYSSSIQTLPRLPSINSLRRVDTEQSLPPHPFQRNFDSGPLQSSSSSFQTLQTKDSFASLPPHPAGARYNDFDGSSVAGSEFGSRIPEEPEVESEGPQQYSRESLVVPPLYPLPRAQQNTRSRESLRSSSFSSLNNAVNQDGDRAAAGPSSWNDSSNTHLRIPMQAHPHQWSGQLSTVASESDRSELTSPTWSRSPRLSSGGSYHSRQVLSISSSLRQELDESVIEDIERPAAAYVRRQPTYGSLRIDHQDEDGEGIADLQELRNRPSRNRLYNSFFNNSFHSSADSRTYSMVSSASSRSNSMAGTTFPTWARIYYGSGEKRLLRSTSMSTIADSRRGSMVSYYHPGGLNNPRRRPRDGDADGDEIEILGPQSPNGEGRARGLFSRFSSRNLRSSSVWSPHLGRDRRAAKLTFWEAPSTTWSTEGRWTGRRNVQVLMFIIGFIFPLAWIIAAFLPLPELPEQPMEERAADSETTMEDYMAKQTFVMEEARYHSARWWRNLNRIMSVVGVVLIATIVTLAVVGVQMGLG